MTLTITAVSSSMRTGGTSPPAETVCGSNDTTANESAPATRSFTRSGVVSALSRTVGSEGTPADSQRAEPDGSPGLTDQSVAFGCFRIGAGT